MGNGLSKFIFVRIVLRIEIQMFLRSFVVNVKREELESFGKELGLEEGDLIEIAYLY